MFSNSLSSFILIHKNFYYKTLLKIEKDLDKILIKKFYFFKFMIFYFHNNNGKI